MKKIFQQVAVLVLLGFTANAQSISPEEYIATYKDIAIREMKRMGVPAAITLAQGLLETESGNSDLVKKSNNHFGIKCKSSWTAGSVSHDDDASGECFRTYPTAEDSYRDHSNFLRGSDRYSFLFKLNPTDYKGWAYGLKTAGYATNPKYPLILIKNIEQYNLQQYSLEGAADMPDFDASKYTDDPEVAEPATTQNDIAANEKPAESATSSFTPGKLIYINGLKCIFAEKGTSLLAIATNYHVNLQKLLDMNELEEDGILNQDQLIFLQKKLKTGSNDFVNAKQNESLYDVAQENGIQLESLLAYNHLNEDAEIAAGTRLYLRPGQEVVTAANSMETKMPEPVKTIIHEVQPKEGLYAVAKKYNVTVKQLREWNNLTSDDLKIGQQLIVSQ